MADDPFVAWDGAYVLGALSPEDRHAFEAHLTSCAACTSRVQQLAGLPGLLARSDPADLLPDAAPALAPATLLPRLVAAATRERRRRRWIFGSGWAAAAVAAAVAVVFAVLSSRAPVTPTPAPSADLVAMAPIGAAERTELSAQVGLTGVTWGTKIELKCTYPAEDAGPLLYQLVVVDRSGQPHPAGGWKIVPGKTATMNASTAVAEADIQQVLVETPDGAAVLSLDR